MTVEFVDPPPESSGEEQLDGGPPRLPRWLWLVLAVVVVTAATGYGIKLSRPSGSSRPVAAHRSGEASSPSPAPPSGRPSCLATVPARWSTAAATAPETLSRQFSVVAVTADGSLIGGYFPPGLDAGTIGFDLLLVPAGSRTVRTLASFRGRSNGLRPEVRVDGHTVLVLLDYGDDHAQFSADQIVAVDSRSGNRTTVLNFGRGKHPLVADAEPFGGSVYWSQASATDPHSNFVYRFNLASRKRTIVFRDSDSLPTLAVSADGLEWSGDDQPDVTVPLPAEVAAHISGSESSMSLITDGSSYAWNSADGIAWWTPGSQVSDVELAGAGITAVAGPFVATLGGSGSQIIDMRTGARIRAARGFIFGSSGVLISNRNPFAARGNHADGRTVLRLPVAALPELRC